MLQGVKQLALRLPLPPPLDEREVDAGSSLSSSESTISLPLDASPAVRFGFARPLLACSSAAGALLAGRRLLGTRGGTALWPFAASPGEKVCLGPIERRSRPVAGVAGAAFAPRLAVACAAATHHERAAKAAYFHRDADSWSEGHSSFVSVKLSSARFENCSF